MRTFIQFSLVVILSSLALNATAIVTTQAHYRLGEDDAAAMTGATVNPTATPLIGATSLARVGTPSYATGNANSGIGVLFNGVDTGYRSPSILAGMNVTNNFGIELSVKSSGSAVGNAALFYMGNSGNSGFGFYRLGADYYVLIGGRGLMGPVPVTTRWTRLALVRINGVMTMYANGVVVQTSTITPGLPSSGGGATAIGMRAQTPATEYFDGVIDDVRAFTFAPADFQLTDLGGVHLAVNVGVNGNVTSTNDGAPSGIACGSVCSFVYPVGTAVELVANALGGATFLGWGGACSGTANCVVNMNNAQSVTANFSSLQQSITFAGLSNTTTSSMPITLSALASSNLDIVFSSLTPTVCTVSANVLTLTSVPGICTVQAAQFGNTSYDSTQSRQSFFVTAAGVASEPRNIVCAAGVASVQCLFDAPTSVGNSVVNSYTLSCTTDNGAVRTMNGTASPLTLAGLPTGSALTCSVLANNMQGASLSSVAASVTPISRVIKQGGIDTDGDGRGEVLVRVGNSASLLGIYNPTSQQINFSPTPDAGANARILGLGDFGARGRTDLLFQHLTSGDVEFWVNFDGFVDSRRFVRNVKPGWVVEAVADLDGDGRSDIIWRYVGSPLNPPTNPNDVGVAFAWFMRDSVITDIKSRGGAPLGWSVLGAADMRGEGKADMIWVSPTGQIRSATSNANRTFINLLIGNAPIGYTPTRLADFNGDGKADILFRNAQGKLKLWVMDGISISSQLDLPDSDALWTLFAIADLNGDGVVDIIFQKPDNSLVLWLMNAATPQVPTVINNAGRLPAGAVNIEP